MKRNLLLFSLCASIVCGCSAGEAGDRNVEMSKSTAAMAAPMAQDSMNAVSGKAVLTLASRPPAPVTIPRAVIRRAELAVRVANVEKSEREVNALVQGWGGYVESAQSSDLETDHPILTMAIRVPSASFDGALAKFESLGVRTSKTISSEDVTGQLVDLDARLSTMRAQEETYRNLLRQSTALDSVISLQDKLTEVRSNIESMASQRKTLGSLASLNNVSLRLEQAASAHAVTTDPNWMAQIWGESTTQFGYVLRFVAGFAVYTLVFSPVWVPILLMALRLRRHRSPSMTSPSHPI